MRAGMERVDLPSSRAKHAPSGAGVSTAKREPGRGRAALTIVPPFPYETLLHVQTARVDRVEHHLDAVGVLLRLAAGEHGAARLLRRERPFYSQLRRGGFQKPHLHRGAAK